MTPRHQEKHFSKAYAGEMIRIARGDLSSAEVLLKAKAGRAENVCYLAHQAIEKSLKAVLCHLELAVPLVHDLGALIARLPTTLDRPFGYELISLNDYAAVRRYEEGPDLLTPEELSEVFGQAKGVVMWAEKLIAKK